MNYKLQNYYKLLTINNKLKKMKKLITTTIFTIAFMMNLNAQGRDGFFTYNKVEELRTENNWSIMPMLPASHGFEYDYDASAPLGSGLLILGGLALAYLRKKSPSRRDS